jgi:hypothetical protein
MPTETVAKPIGMLTNSTCMTIAVLGILPKMLKSGMVFVDGALFSQNGQ